MSSPKSSPAALLATLTPREREVIQWLPEGKTNWVIGQILGCDESTVKKHLQRSYRKLRVENRLGVVCFLMACVMRKPAGKDSHRRKS